MSDTHQIDAAGKALGRVASEAAKALMGKTLASYTPNVFSDVKVSITNASKLKVSDRKAKVKIYQKYSGYPGGQRRETLSSLRSRRGMNIVLRAAIERMLPRNSMRVPRLKNLTISE